MPVYLEGYNGQYVSSRVHYPETSRHMVQYLARMNKDHFTELQRHAKVLSKTPNHVKIKPESYSKIIRAKTSHDLIKPVIIEHLNHENPRLNSHKGGGIVEGVLNVIQTAVQAIGGKNVSEWGGPEITHKDLSEAQIDMAQLVNLTYNDKRVDQFENYTRVPEYDSRYGALYRDSHGEFTFAVRGTKGNMRDIWKDARILSGRTNSQDTELNESFTKFKNEHPGVKVNVAMHSLGTELGFNGADRMGLPVREFYAFNPASSPTWDKGHILHQLDRPNVKFFLSPNDPVSKSYNQNLRTVDSSDIYMGEFYRSPIASHKMGQWIS